MSTTTTSRPSVKVGSRASTRSAFVAGASPQVNLLPNEVLLARGLKRLQVILGIAVLGVIALVAVAFLGAVANAAAAESGLEGARERTNALMREQLKYAEVPVVLGQIDSARTARAYGMSTEILWRDYLDAVNAVTPDGVTIATLVVTAQTPTIAAPSSAHVLEEPNVASVDITGAAPTLPDVTQWISQLNSIPGVTDARISAAEVQGDAETDRFYKITGTIRLTEEAWSGRYTGGDETK